jgi:hypothetical protein
MLENRRRTSTLTIRVKLCPLKLEGKNINPTFLKTVTITGYEVTDASELQNCEFIFVIEWVVEFMNGLQRKIPMPLGIEKADFVFGRERLLGTSQVP